MDKSAILSEYNSLRDEILHLKKERTQLIYITVIIWGFIVSFGGKLYLDFKDIQILLLTFLILNFILIVIINHISSIQLHIRVIGGYIRKFIEPQIEGLNWETASQICDEWMTNMMNRKNKYLSKIRKTIPSLGNMYILASLLNIAIFGILIYEVFKQKLEIVWIILSIFGLFVSLWSLFSAIDLAKAKSLKWTRINWSGIDPDDIKKAKSKIVNNSVV